MVRNRSLARHVSDAAFGELRRQLVLANRWFPFGKTCSGCGDVDAGLTLADRTYRCRSCGLVLDRDVNAAVNLARLALAEADASPPQPVAA